MTPLDTHSSPRDSRIDTSLVESENSKTNELAPRAKITVFAQHLRRINAYRNSPQKSRLEKILADEQSPGERSLETIQNQSSDSLFKNEKIGLIDKIQIHNTPRRKHTNLK